MCGAFKVSGVRQQSDMGKEVSMVTLQVATTKGRERSKNLLIQQAKMALLQGQKVSKCKL